MMQQQPFDRCLLLSIRFPMMTCEYFSYTNESLMYHKYAFLAILLF